MTGRQRWYALSAAVLGLLALLWGFGRSDASAQGERSPVNDGRGFQRYTAGAPQTGTALVPRPLEVPDLYAFEKTLESGVRQVILVDSESKRICVYHVDLQGKIEFAANRNFEWDLKMDDFNGTGLTPGEIREAVERADLNR